MIDFKKEIEPFVLGQFHKSDYFSVSMYSNESPLQGSKVDIDGLIYEVIGVHDDTDDEEREQGLSYDRVTFQII
jgi:hypothetical protein